MKLIERLGKAYRKIRRSAPSETLAFITAAGASLCSTLLFAYGFYTGSIAYEADNSIFLTSYLSAGITGGLVMLLKASLTLCAILLVLLALLWPLISFFEEYYYEIDASDKET